ncbi:hypothetical protein VPH35_048971 [Triticum aestivum]
MYDYQLLIAGVYSSETDTWGNSILTEASDDTLFGHSTSTLVGNSLYWPAKHKGNDILEFDLRKQNLTVIKRPHGMNMNDFDNFHIIEEQDGAVGLAALSHLKLQMWQRKVNCLGVAIWLLRKTVSLSELLKIPGTVRWNEWLKLVGYDEDTGAIFLTWHDVVCMVQLKSIKARRAAARVSASYCYSFTSFYPLGDCSSLFFIS